MDSEDSIEYQIAAYVYKSFTVVFLLVGTVTNILSAIVYSKKHMRKSSYSVYLFALAIVDLLVTINGNVRLFLMSYEIDLFKTAQNFATWKLDDASPSARFLFKGNLSPSNPFFYLFKYNANLAFHIILVYLSLLSYLIILILKNPCI